MDVGSDNGAPGLSHVVPADDYAGAFLARHSGQSHNARSKENV
jgi:hypothetical protein